MNLVWLPITDGEIRNAFKVWVKTPKGKRQLGRLRRGRNGTAEFHFDKSGMRLLSGLVWCWVGPSALSNKITKYTNLIQHSHF